MIYINVILKVQNIHYQTTFETLKYLTILLLIYVQNVKNSLC